MDKQYFLAKRVLVDQSWRDQQILTVDENGYIEAIDRYEQHKYDDKKVIDLGETILLPGLIDSHVHGAMGHDVMDATHHALDSMSTFFAQNGVTGFLATTVTAPPVKIEAALKQIGLSTQSGVSGAELLGGYLEGPYFTEKNRGAHPTEWFRDLTVAELKSWQALAGDTLRKVALAPEKSNALEIIKHLKSCDIKVMLGHTDADFDTVNRALDAGADGIVHCYNGMRGLHHRDPGVVGAGLCHPNSYVEMIADGHHVHPTAIDVAYRCCGERLTLITDAMQAAGMPDGQYQLGEYQVNVVEGVVRTDAGGLAGSTLILKNAVFNLSNWLNMPLEKAWLRASLTPAKSLGIEHELGSLVVGKKASMVALSITDHQVEQTWVNGVSVYSR
ncbi:N-acetylglucosamine-6-phosphate deacetylase [Vibrio sp. S11_S32]|uniref:N-acetylglucosamine-6-phosphate deacetylase n=1 Tax=Vibrio sp. S11_S32 TaxID=2720225 RepID=UPI0016800AD5|nr:N-acetylglucosamine-6-phosphate deacetylase [Vibrio sp. S11_S32]MBD1575748.1 N-acetylglucosamine-6-phosphate deacetylase [Vibrio sp. S11_S32]